MGKFRFGAPTSTPALGGGTPLSAPAALSIALDVLPGFTSPGFCSLTSGSTIGFNKREPTAIGCVVDEPVPTDGSLTSGGEICSGEPCGTVGVLTLIAPGKGAVCVAPLVPATGCVGKPSPPESAATRAAEIVPAAVVRQLHQVAPRLRLKLTVL